MTHEEMALEELLIAFAESFVCSDLEEMEQVCEEIKARLRER